jgi:hypothetical protein
MRSFLKRIAAVAVLATTAVPVSVAAAQAENLYRARAIVTGQREETRVGGIAEAFRFVLAKVSGDPRLLDDPRVAAMADEAGAFVTGFGYRDRMAGKPLADEQGSRDRPYDLTVDFDPERIDAALRSLGREPWTAARPSFVAVITMRNGQTSHQLTADGGMELKRQRMALGLAADRFGLSVSLPTRAVLSAASENFDAIAGKVGADLVLVGDMTWSDEAHGWISEWGFTADGRSYGWQHRGGGFDEAFRRGVGGAAQILSGNGHPGR